MKEHGALTLGNVLEELNKYYSYLNVTDVHGNGICNPHSYRGIYEHVAFEPTTDAAQVGEVINMIKDNVLNLPFYGYKGGEFTMTTDSFAWISFYGMTNGNGLITGIEQHDEYTIHIVTSSVDW